MNVKFLKVTGFLSGRKIGHVLPLDPNMPYHKDMNNEPKKITKQVPTLAVDGYNINVGGKGKTGSYVDIAFLEDVDKNTANVVSSVRLTLDQFMSLSIQIDNDSQAVRAIQSSTRG